MQSFSYAALILVVQLVSHGKFDQLFRIAFAEMDIDCVSTLERIFSCQRRFYSAHTIYVHLVVKSTCEKGGPIVRTLR